MKINHIKFNIPIKNKLLTGAKFIIGTTLISGISSGIIKHKPIPPKEYNTTIFKSLYIPKDGTIYDIPYLPSYAQSKIDSTKWCTYLKTLD